MAHTFGELLRVYVALRQVGDDSLNQSDLAQAVGVTKTTINNWMKGKYTPRSPDQISTLAKLLELSEFEHDALAYAVNPAWVEHKTPIAMLENFALNRYRERIMPIIIPDDDPPSIAEMEEDWRIAFKDTFENNTNHWGLGWRDDGVCRVERSIANGCYTLKLENRFYNNVNLGGDSACIAPPVYYASIEAQRIGHGNEDEDGYALIFEEVNDSCHAIFRIRDGTQKFSVFRPELGGDRCITYHDATFHCAIRKHQNNKLAIVANAERHWFYVNDVFVAYAIIPRIQHSRLDVGIVCYASPLVLCEYRNFIVRVPPH